MAYAAYFDGINSYIEVPDSPEFSGTYGNKKLTVIYTFQPTDVTGYVRLVEKGRVGEYEWIIGHRVGTGGTNFHVYEAPAAGGYGIGMSFTRALNVPNETIVVANTFNDVTPGNRYVNIYDNGVIKSSNRRVDGVAGIIMTNRGSGYTSAPTVSITGGGGTGAAITATISGGQVYVGEMGNYGYGYTSDPLVTFTGGGTGAAGYAYRCFPWDGPSPLYIGHNPTRPDRNPSKGYMYEVAIFNDELSSPDILALYNRTKLPSDFTTLIMWHNYRLGNANDQSGRGHNGILRGNTVFVSMGGTCPTSTSTLVVS